MLDKEGYRPNVGIVLANQRNEVFWGKRVNQHAWQFPQGGIDHGETPVQAMYRELEYWVPLEAVIEFKREVYRQALIELHRFLLADRRARLPRALPVG